jgi:hypothetical protein
MITGAIVVYAGPDNVVLSGDGMHSAYYGSSILAYKMITGAVTAIQYTIRHILLKINAHQ